MSVGWSCWATHLYTRPLFGHVCGCVKLVFLASVSHELSMSKQIKRLLLGSMVASGFVAVTAVVDLIISIPYSGNMVFDALFLVTAAIVIYMGYETLKEST